MKLRLECPRCDFSVEIPEERIPARAKWANCPKCKSRFLIRPGDAPPQNQETPPPPLPEEPLATMTTAFHTIRIPTPWEDRFRIGLWKGIYRTFLNVVFYPSRTFGTMRYRGGYKEPFCFGLLFGALGILFSVFWDIVLARWGLGGSVPGAFPYLGGHLLFLLSAAFSPLLVALYLFILTAVLHGALLMVRGGPRGLEASFRAVSYSQAAQIYGVIPIVGGFVSAVWFLAILVVGLKNIHDTSYARVLLALLIPFFLLGLLLAALLIPLTISLLSH